MVSLWLLFRATFRTLSTQNMRTSSSFQSLQEIDNREEEISVKKVGFLYLAILPLHNLLHSTLEALLSGVDGVCGCSLKVNGTSLEDATADCQANKNKA